MRHQRRIASTVLGAALFGFGISAEACSCVRFDPNWWNAHTSDIFVAEVTAVDAEHPLTVDWGEHRNVNGLRVSYRVTEILKGAPRTGGSFTEVGFEFACNPQFQLGHAYVILLAAPDEERIGLCHTLPPTTEILGPLRAAVQGKR
jgi:hypothetical protein